MQPLATSRLRLWPCRADDVDALLEQWRDPDVRRYLWDDELISRGEAQQVVNAFLASAASRGLGLWTLERTDATGLAGFCALREIPQTVEVELLYGLAPHCWGSGLATEGARAVIDYGLHQLHLARIWARTDPPNTASQRVMQRLGMRRSTNPGYDTRALVTYVLDGGRDIHWETSTAC